MNYGNQSIGCSQPSNRFLLVLMLTVALSLAGLTSCSTRKESAKMQELSVRRQNLMRSDTLSFVDHSIVFDTIHVVASETIWREPDSLGVQYPLRTIHSESGGNRVRDSERVYQRKDTVYVSVDDSRFSSTDSKIRAPDGQSWVPWVVMAGMIVVGIVIIVIRVLIR